MKWWRNKRESVFRLDGTDVIIHKVANCGDNLNLTYRPLGIEYFSLGTENFEEAKRIAAEYIYCKQLEVRAKIDADKDALIHSALEPDTFVRG